MRDECKLIYMVRLLDGVVSARRHLPLPILKRGKLRALATPPPACVIRLSCGRHEALGAHG